MLKAKHWHNKGKGVVECVACHNNCIIANGKRGRCGVRANIDGKLYLDAHIASINVDPIEKKPFFHFLPGSKALSIGVFGCNFSCKYCQNWEISQISGVNKNLLKESLSCEDISSEQFVDQAKKNGWKVIAYTYTEPTIAIDCFEKIGKLAKSKGLKNVFVTNGYMNLDEIDFSWIDGFSVDVKGDDEFYQKIVGVKKGAQKIIFNNIKKMREAGKWVEIETLVIPEENNDKTTLETIAKNIAKIDPEIPWHILAFYPCYKMRDHRPTSLEDIQKAIEIGKKAGLKYVYAGNISEYEDTYCPKCGKKIIERNFYYVDNKVVDGRCPFCGEKIAGVWK